MPISELKKQALAVFSGAKNLAELDSAYHLYLGRKGKLTLLLRSLRELPETSRREKGKEANDLHDFLEQQFSKRKQELQKEEFTQSEKAERIDVTAPGKRIALGRLHPLTRVQRAAIRIFGSMGFGVAEGPHIEAEWYNFDALNIPANHPARDMWDTFWLKDSKNSRLLLRTHTSPVQIRYMESHQPPFRIIATGRVFRYEATDAKHSFDLHQLEGLMVGRDVSVAHFKAVIQKFYELFFAKSMTIRLRPSYFPFVEPGFEVDMSCVICGGTGKKAKNTPCSSCGHTGWLEMMGAGMVHPNVFKAAGYNPREWQGFAFGMGVERLAMMKFGVPDIRLFFEGDLQFIRQF